MAFLSFNLTHQRDLIHSQTIEIIRPLDFVDYVNFSIDNRFISYIFKQKMEEQNKKSQTVDISFKQVGFSEETRFENVHTEIVSDSITGSKAVAKEIADLIREKDAKGEKCVLGLATGSSPVKVYEELIRMHKEEELSFKNVITFNLDEYYPMKKEDIQSYWHFMHENLFNHVDIQPDNINIPDGTLAMDEIIDFGKNYEAKIEACGGLDLQILGIGRTGHIGFNEPGSTETSRTRIITLDHITRVDAAKDFFGIDNVPRKAITMGVGTILHAKRIILMAWGHGKAPIIKETVEGRISTTVPATYLQQHSNTTFVVDQEASSELTRFQTPWLVGDCDWEDESLKKQAVFWLCKHLGKPLLKLTDRDYNDYGMSAMLAQEGSAYSINIRMFNELQHTITGWPGGKPNTDDTYRPERAAPSQKRVIVFSPHPDDDVISMGGTFIRLSEQGHDVHVAYQTSGNIAVNDHDALRFSEFVSDYFKKSGEDSCNAAEDLYSNTLNDHNEKINSNLEVDSPRVRLIKGLIRRGEAKAGARYCGVKDENIHFLDLPFYETGKVKKAPIGPKDIEIIENLIKEVKPHQIFAAGDLADPHGTHKVCLDAIFAALENLKHEEYMKDCWVWLYRGAWHEWDTHEIEMAVPISPDELYRKRQAIFFHQSQKDNVVFQGNDKREFWQRAEERNRTTAKSFNDLGLAEYEAIEAFRRYHFLDNE
ncbi:glucosamine-6-phosphate deaminase [Aureibacter tunicatorum]|uniref:Glucosamine-6-phosphate deaminase n=1 Tax=Aureibacter tunicatorum TaxID=866807 RepID=A0AAE3XRR4_9BACT|nr:glucosamine-6-phosphate deaminase [Aureibacter tunicatorum]MDR6240259.1 glucosamine-6-phosphate deaminase [Aureibacter tunicatorum]BDD05860.1 putative glucosamine-6-phosphate deaminase-like protein [Aureibacter tunicatorum]